MFAWMRSDLISFSNPFKVRRSFYFAIIFICFILGLVGCEGHLVGVLNPKGIITYEERKLLFDTLALMLIVVLPVIIMSFVFVYHYQASHQIKDYKPNWGHSYFLETLWWGIPCIIVFILAIITWKKTHELDPYRPISGHSQPTINVQAIALPWKWLFIYPQESIATINYLVVPVGHQVEYWLTTDNVPMSAFFIPQIGSQIYAMAGMRTRLFLIGNQVGEFDGLNAQFNGNGFSDMHFPVYVVTEENYKQWIEQVKQSKTQLDAKTYLDLLHPTIANPPQFFSNVLPNLFDDVVAIYRNTFGTVHPRQNIIPGFKNPIHSEGHH